MRAHDPSSFVALAEQPFFGVALTVFAYLLGLYLYRRSGKQPLLHPTLVAVLVIVAVLGAADLPYTAYMEGAGLIHFLLGPAVVLLAVPLVRQRRLIRTSGRVIGVALAIGSTAGIASALGLAWLLGAHAETFLSLAPKSVTTGIAIGVSEAIGGVPALTAVLVIMTGIVGAICGPAAAALVQARDARAIGLAMGIAAHGLGTARALQMSEVAGAFATLGMGLNGVLTAVLLALLTVLT